MLTLREVTLDDAPAVQRIYCGASVRFTHRNGYRMTPEDAHRRVTEVLHKAREKPRTVWDFAIAIDGDMCGLITLRASGPELGSLSYILRHEVWGRGYATEAVRDIVAFAFAHTDLRRVTAKHHPDNLASGRVLEKAGFTRVATLRLRADDGTVVPYQAYTISCRCADHPLGPTSTRE
ncbi:GNAT family N-acetyltransferase [Streptomyces murinus]|uniref:GNAT family N-acetyltransferase n=1 Tax=Streptomyces murinus TaxID=33900 RepID=UPI0037F6A759